MVGKKYFNFPNIDRIFSSFHKVIYKQYVKANNFPVSQINAQNILIFSNPL